MPCRAKQDASTGQGKQWEVGAKGRDGKMQLKTRKGERHIQIYVLSGMDLDAVGCEVGSTLGSHLAVRLTTNKRWDVPLHRRSTLVQVEVAWRFGQSNTYPRAQLR